MSQENRGTIKLRTAPVEWQMATPDHSAILPHVCEHIFWCLAYGEKMTDDDFGFYGSHEATGESESLDTVLCLACADRLHDADLMLVGKRSVARRSSHASMLPHLHPVHDVAGPVPARA